MVVDIGDFEDLFGNEPDVAYGQKAVDQIDRNRRHLNGELFFDRLLKALGISQGSRLYPPRSNRDLRSLHVQILDSASPDHHKQSLVYYVLRDLDPSDAELFARRCHLPPKYRIFTSGIWHLDRLEFETALEHLTCPSLTPTFPHEILRALCLHAAHDPTLALAYHDAVGAAALSAASSSTGTETLDAFFALKCRASVTEAFYFARAQGPARHRHLFERLVAFVHAGEGDAAAGCVELIGLPLTKDEEEPWLEACLADRRLRGGRDTLVVWRMARGRLQAAAEAARGTRERTIDGVSWPGLIEALQQAS